MKAYICDECKAVISANDVVSKTVLYKSHGGSRVLRSTMVGHLCQGCFKIDAEDLTRKRPARAESPSNKEELQDQEDGS